MDTVSLNNTNIKGIIINMATKYNIYGPGVLLVHYNMFVQNLYTLSNKNKFLFNPWPAS